MLYKTARHLFNKVILKKISYKTNVIEIFTDEINKSCVISSPSAWELVKSIKVLDPSTLLLNQSLQYHDVKKLSINEEVIYGIGGGRVLDIAKAVAKLNKKKCILIPTILSTTAWLNPMASLKNNEKVYHAPGKINQIIIDPDLIVQSPQHLNIGGIADILCGYNSLSDWVLAKKINKDRMPKNAYHLVSSFLNRIKEEFLSHIPLTSDSVLFIVDSFKEALGLCWGLLSGRPVEGSEHFLYYALEEIYNKPMNHGAIIALNTLVCMKLRGKEAIIEPNELKAFYDEIGIKYSLTDLKIPLDVYEEALESMNDFVLKNKLMFSLWNLEDIFKDCSIQEILDWIH